VSDGLDFAAATKGRQLRPNELPDRSVQLRWRATAATLFSSGGATRAFVTQTASSARPPAADGFLFDRCEHFDERKKSNGESINRLATAALPVLPEAANLLAV